MSNSGGPSTQMIYRHGRDVHLQLPPSDFTVSLNLMFNEPEVRLRPQHNYDPAAGRVVGFPAGTMSIRRTEMIRLAERIGDANTVNMLEDLVGRTPCRRTREASRLGAQALRDRLAGTRMEAPG